MISSRVSRTAASFLLAGVIALFLLPAQPVSGAPAAAKIPFPRPQSHNGNWIEYHGRSAGGALNPASPLENACLACHQRTDCISCHQTRPPRDHTNTWRTLSHGFTAGDDRERCQICHKQDFCIRCHTYTTPRTHTGAWTTQHCTWCHFTTALRPADNCGVCHRIAPHTSAPHSLAGRSNCSVCHKP